MNFNKFIAVASFLLTATILFSQQQGLTGCAVGLEDGALIKERMLENRRNIAEEQIQAFQNSRAVTYIPVKYTICGDNNGSGYVDIDQVFAMHCDMNDDYRTQDVQFVLKDANNSVRYANNLNMYNDGSSFNSQSFMFSNKVSGAINIYLSASINNSVASYYSGFGDFIFVLNQMANGTSSTGSHEVGHFFSLNHTFYGWEGAPDFNNGTAPSTVNGSAVERVARSGAGSNCNSAADGFCDTPADYIAYRAFCPYNSGGKDPNGVDIDPTESLIMSYFADNCVDSFTQQQKNAIAADIISRGWQNFSAPSPNTPTNGLGITSNSPSNGATIELNGDVTLNWTADPNATGYVVFVERTLFGTPIESVVKAVVYGSTSYTIPQSMLSFPRQYTYRVKPFNQYNTCGVYSSPVGFTVVAPATSVSNQFNSLAELKILSNPVNASTADILINVPQATTASMLLYSIDGKQILNMQNLELNAGDNLQLLDVSSLSNGVYIFVLTSPEGSLQQKMLIQR